MYTFKNNDVKTAFVLSGGGSRGAYEIGVWQALIELGIRIDIVTGTSVGALNGAAVSQGQLEVAVDLWNTLETDMVFDTQKNGRLLPKLDLKIESANTPLDVLSGYARQIVNNAGMEYNSLKTILMEHLNEETIRGSRTEYGIVTTELDTMRPRFLYKDDIPQGQLIDYMLASASCFPALKSYEIDNVSYIDGGYTDNLPIGMALEKGATHVIAVNLDTIGVVHKRKIAEANFIKIIECEWDLGNFLVFDKANSKRIMRLGYLDAMKSFGAYDGSAYCFIKGQMDRRSLGAAESAGRVFDLDPQLIYSKTSFNDRLKEAYQTYYNEMQDQITQDFHDLSHMKLINLPNLLKRVNNKTLTVIILQRLQQSENQRIQFAGKAAAALFKQESEAANYLIRSKLV